MALCINFGKTHQLAVKILALGELAEVAMAEHKRSSRYVCGLAHCDEVTGCCGALPTLCVVTDAVNQLTRVCAGKTVDDVSGKLVVLAFAARGTDPQTSA